MLCPANWRQQPDELAFVIDDLTPVVIIDQDEEVGATTRAGIAAAHHTAARVIVHDVDVAQRVVGVDHVLDLRHRVADSVRL